MDFVKVASALLVTLIFAASLITAIVAFVYSFVFSIRMMFQFKERGIAYSTATLWNPMNAMFRPELLSAAGQRSRQIALKGLLIFLLAWVCCAGIAVGVKFWGGT
jgi:hypothetical protein